MPTRVVLNCPRCGMVETFNYVYPEGQSDQQYCPICGYEYATVMSAELVPVEGETRIIEPIEKEDHYGKERKRKGN
jgi:transcription elongation factor Elf1